MKPRPSHFTRAARNILLRKLHEAGLPGGDEEQSPFCCDQLNELDDECLYNAGPEFELFEALFKPESPADGVGWWPRLKGWNGCDDAYDHWDYESRILALLLAAEIARESDTASYLVAP